EHRRHADALFRLDSIPERGDQPVTQLLSVELSRDHAATDVDAATRRQLEFQCAGSDRRGKTRTRKVVRDQGRMEILETPETYKHEVAARPEVAAGHRAGRKRRGLGHPERRR